MIDPHFDFLAFKFRVPLREMKTHFVEFAFESFDTLFRKGLSFTKQECFVASFAAEASLFLGMSAGKRSLSIELRSLTRRGTLYLKLVPLRMGVWYHLGSCSVAHRAFECAVGEGQALFAATKTLAVLFRTPSLTLETEKDCFS